MKCLETRTDSMGAKRRRYEDTSGVRITTIEVPLSVLKSMGMARVRQQMAMWQRGQDRRAKARENREAVERLLNQPRPKPTAIAHEVGITEARVRQIRAEIKQAQSPQSQPTHRAEPRLGKHVPPH